MRYLLAIIEPPNQRRERTEAEGHEAYERMLRYADELKQQGKLLATESLSSLANAARVEVRGGRPRIQDGPFVEAKEMIGGFFLVDCASMAEAIELAKRCPAAEWCTVEVRAAGPCYDA
jgi:hypothetical protein